VVSASSISRRSSLERDFLLGAELSLDGLFPVFVLGFAAFAAFAVFAFVAFVVFVVFVVIELLLTFSNA
jgi:hypothetical protein